MKGGFNSAQTAAMRSAIERVCASDSMTHGPAIRNGPLGAPSRREPTGTSRVRVVGIACVLSPRLVALRNPKKKLTTETPFGFAPFDCAQGLRPEASGLRQGLRLPPLDGGFAATEDAEPDRKRRQGVDPCPTQ